MTLVLIGVYSSSKAQAPTAPTPQFALRTDLIPPSPNAAALGKYGIVPVSLQTGIPDISIPITEARGRELQLPITLNYHNNGFKPTEEASWVGLGWSLNAGGVVTRIVKDKVDEFVADAGKYDNTSWRYSTVDSVTRTYLDSALYLGVADTEPDIYAFNFAGYSGKFFIYKGTCYQYPYQQLTIAGGPSSGFTIITPEGNQYNFTVPEVTISRQGVNQGSVGYTLPNRYVSSWYLGNIQSADNKDQITLNYATAETIEQQGPATQTLTVQQYFSVPQYTVSKLARDFSTQIATVRLASITTSKMIINFVPASAYRLDMPSSALDNIKIFNYKGELLNQFKFDLAYFSNNVNDNINNLRLKLTGLEEGTNPSTVKKHLFYYNDVSNIYPSKVFPATDDWGYWNDSNDIDPTGNGYNNIIPKKYYPQGMIKDPNFQYSQVAVINKIVYPTGGSTVFQFEPNIYYNGLHYKYNDMQDVDFINRMDTTSTDLQTNTTTFTLNYDQMVRVITTRKPKIPVDPPGVEYSNGPDAATKDFVPEATIVSGSQSYPFTIVFNRDNLQKIDSIYLAAGTYSMTIKLSPKEDAVQGFVNYSYKTNQVIEGLPGPGLRIKTITDYTNASTTGTPATVKEYTYVDSLGLSTGVLLNTPHYGPKTYEEITFQISSLTHDGVVEDKVYNTYTSTSSNGLSPAQDMYYKAVREKQNNGSDFLLSESDFDVYDPLVENGTSVFLNRKTEFKKVGSTYTPLVKQEYSYSLIQNNSFVAIKPYIDLRRIPGDCGIACGVPADSMRHYKYDRYSIEPSWLRLNSERHVGYFNTSDSLVTSTSYVYDAPLRNRISTTTDDSRGNYKIEKNKYHENYAINVFTPGINDVVEKQLWYKRADNTLVLTNGVITQYDPTFLKPKTLYSFESAAPVSSLDQETVSGGLYTSLLSDSRYKSRLVNTYDNSTGNLISQDMTGAGTPLHQANYLWGYHNNYPIAEVKNADLASIAFTSFEDDDNSWTYTAASVLTAAAGSPPPTGVKYYTGTISKSGLTLGNYILSLWARGSGTITVGGVVKTITGTWTNYQWQLSNITSVSVNSNGNAIDEVSLVPVNALITTYTYDPEVGVTTSTDPSGKITYYEYDYLQRLVNIKDKEGNIVKHYDYHYAQ